MVRTARTLSPTDQLQRSFKASGSSRCWTTYADATGRGSRRRSQQTKRGARKCLKPWTLLSFPAPTPGISAQTYPANAERCCLTPAVSPRTWLYATKVPIEGMRDLRSAERLFAVLTTNLCRCRKLPHIPGVAAWRGRECRVSNRPGCGSSHLILREGGNNGWIAVNCR